MSGPSTGHMRWTLSSTTRWKKPPSSGISCTSRRRRSGSREGRQARRHGEVGDLRVRRVEQERVHAPVEAVEDADRPTGDLGHDVEALRVGLVEQAEHLAPHLGVLVGLVEVDAHGAARSASEVGHPRPLVDRHAGVVGRELEHAVTGAGASASPMASSSSGRRVGARHQLAVLRAVQRRAAGGEPQRAGAQRLLHELGHPEGVRARSRARWRRPARPSRTPAAGRGRSGRRRRAPWDAVRRHRGTRGSSSTPR